MTIEEKILYDTKIAEIGEDRKALSEFLLHHGLWHILDLEDIPGEKWFDIPGYRGCYKISSFSRFKSLHRVIDRKATANFKGGDKKTISESILSPILNNRGYLVVSLRKGGVKVFAAHRLVAITQIPKVKGKPIVHHKNHIRHDCRKINLEWSTYSDNCIAGYRENGRMHNMQGKTGFKSPIGKKVKCLDNGKIYGSAQDAARSIGVSLNSVGLVCNGKQKSTKGLVFKYI